MRSSRFALLLLILFSAAFWWSGGGNLVVPSVPSFKPLEPLTGNISSIWDHTYRIVALKSAVNSKLNKKHYVKLQDIPLSMQQAIIAIEDNRYYRHFGFDIEGIMRATLINMQAGSIAEGGSTITQQLVKNLFLTQERSLSRKAEEVILAIDLELRYSKEEILEMYLNTIYFGSGAYGIGEACQVYFAKAPADLNLAECALLAGLPNAPSFNSPYVDFSAAKQRQSVVLAAMMRNGYIGPKLAEDSKLVPILLAN